MMAVAAKLLIAFAALAASVEAGQTAGLDADAGAARGTPGSGLAWAFEAITDLGGAWVVVPCSLLVCALLVRARRYADALLVALAVAAARTLTMLGKLTFARERPDFDDAIGTEGTFAFPSGHTSAAMALYGALALLVLRSELPRRVRVATAGALGLLIAAIGFSRVYLGVHYATDVLAGALLGAACIAFAAAVTVRLHARRAVRA